MGITVVEVLCLSIIENEKVVSYPMEVGFKFKDDLFGFVDKLTGSPKYIPDFNPKIDILDYFDAKEKLIQYINGVKKNRSSWSKKKLFRKAFMRIMFLQNLILRYQKNF